jgi:hypothetical protein
VISNEPDYDEPFMAIEYVQACPVCLRIVDPTRHKSLDYIPRHDDSLGKPCPAGGYPYWITVTKTREIT